MNLILKIHHDSEISIIDSQITDGASTWKHLATKSMDKKYERKHSKYTMVLFGHDADCRYLRSSLQKIPLSAVTRKSSQEMEAISQRLVA